MSREVRRVPVEWRHPVEPNPYWEIQTARRLRLGDPASRLHGPAEQFVPLLGRSIIAYYDDPSEVDERDLMPAFDVPEDSLGWCLYETVSEGTPVTPVFASAPELIGHLSAVGEDWDQKPYRRAAAEALVKEGSSFGSFVVTGGRLLHGAKDLDVLSKGTQP